MKLKKTITSHFKTLKFLEKAINLPPLFSGNLPLVVYLLILIVLCLYHTAVNACNLASKRDYIALKAEIDKTVINKLVTVPTGLNNLKTKVDNLNVGKLKTIPRDFKN